MPTAVWNLSVFLSRGERERENASSTRLLSVWLYNLHMLKFTHASQIHLILVLLVKFLKNAPAHYSSPD